MSLIQPPLIELRQYVLAPGKRARMVELFDAHFAAAQTALGLPVLGQFCLAGKPDVLVWIRGFPDMATRPERLGGFYGGSIWGEFGAEAIGYVIGFDNVQLLREAAGGSGLQADPAMPRAVAKDGAIIATTYSFKAPAEDDVLAACLAHAGGTGLLGAYVSEEAPNNFPNLPIRAGEHLFTWFATDMAAAPPAFLAERFVAAPEVLRLEPVGRSALQ
jgi:hypothetical protein